MSDGIDFDAIIEALSRDIIFHLNIKFIIITFLLLVILIVQGTDFYYKYYGDYVYPAVEYDSIGYVANTGSMQPCIKGNSEIYYTHNFTLEVGEIYVYEKNDSLTNYSLIIHRLMYIDTDWCFFKGDNNLGLDDKINCSTIQKKVVAIAYP